MAKKSAEDIVDLDRAYAIALQLAELPEVQRDAVAAGYVSELCELLAPAYD